MDNKEDIDVFSDIRPTADSEVANTISQLVEDKRFQNAVMYIKPNMPWEDFGALLKTFTSKYDFQTKIIAPLIKGLAQRSSTSVEGNGWEKFDNASSHIFISNHRDIILDAGLFNILRHERGLPTTEIAIGDNLFVYPWIERLVRLNKSFVVRRNISVRQMLEVSKHLSEYIHHTIKEKKESVWIAQREGRAKDADDRTQESLLKMLSLVPNKNNPGESLKELDIVPLSISYEYDPCDYLKAAEFQLKRDNPAHKKTQEDDLRNMETGLMGFKGQIHFGFGRPINELMVWDDIAILSKQELFTRVAQVIDREIFLNYKIFPANYIAYDMLHGQSLFSKEYTTEDKENFCKYISMQVEKINIPDKDESFLTEKILQMYSNILQNHQKAMG